MNSILSDIRSIKYNRMSEEERYICSILNNLDVYTFKILPYTLIFKLGGDVMFEYNIQSRRIRGNKFHLFYPLEQKLSYPETYLFIKDMVKKYLINDIYYLERGLRIFEYETTISNSLGLAETDLIKMNFNIKTLNDYISDKKKKLKNE